MLVSISEGDCRDGLLGAILLVDMVTVGDGEGEGSRFWSAKSCVVKRDASRDPWLHVIYNRGKLLYSDNVSRYERKAATAH